MKQIALVAGVLATALLPTLAAAQTVTLPQVKNSGGNNIGSGASVLIGSDGVEKGTASNPLPIVGKSEAFQLASANASSAAATVYGGAYTLTQSCTSYNAGSMTLRYRGPDGATMMTLLTKTAADSAGGTLVSLGSGAVIDVTLPSGSTGCNVLLARVP